MSILGTIVSTVLGHGRSTPAPQKPASPTSGGTASSAPAPSPSQTTSGSAHSSSVDVEAVVSGLAAKKKEKLDWRHSIVDLMKVLDLDSGVQARKQLAQELHYTGDTKDSAKMNVWLHKQVMTKLAENGGKVPEDLKH